MSFQKLLEELENEDLDIPAHIREARFGELRKQAAEFEGMRDRDHGLYRYVHPGENDMKSIVCMHNACMLIFQQDINSHIHHHYNTIALAMVVGACLETPK